MIRVEGYRCDHCNAAGRVRRTYASAQSCAKHERNCYRNPAARACATCALWTGDPGERACEENHDLETDVLGEIPGTHHPKMRCPHWKPKSEDQP